MNTGLKYVNIADSLRQRIQARHLPPGKQLPTEPNLAREFGVGRVTVRRALSILETEGLLRREKGRGTFVHDSVPDVSARQILYVGEMHTHYYKDYYINLVAEMQDSNDSLTGYAVGPKTDLERELNGLPDMLQQATHLICHAGFWPVVRKIMPPTIQGFAVTGLYPAEGETAPGYYIYANWFEAARLACQHLLDHGHNRICFLGPNWDAGSTDVIEDAFPTTRYVGTESVIRERRHGVFSSIGQWGRNPAERRESLQTALQALDRWPDAFVAESDFRAVDLLRVTEGLGRRCPDDFSLVSMGNTPWSEVTDPPISSVCLGDQEMAHLAAQLCREPVPDRAMTFMVGPHIIDRGTVKFPRSPS